MISLKIEHKHHLPCHPTRAFLQKQGSIHETDREDQSQQSSQENPQFKTIQSRAINPYIDNRLAVSGDLSDTASRASEQLIKKKKRRRQQKPINISSIQQISHTDILQKAFVDSGGNLPKNVRALIMQKQKLIEDKVYIGTINNDGQAVNTILQRVYVEETGASNVQNYVRENLLNMMGQIHKNLTNEINEQKYYVHKIVRSTKNDILTNKKGRLNLNYSTNKTNSSFPYNSASEADNMTTNSQPVSHDYSLNSNETKRAQQFIKKIQKQQIQQRQKRKQIEQQKKNLQIRSAQEKRQFEEQIKQQRRNYLKRRFQAKKQIREKQIQVREKMNKQYKQFLAKYKKKTPLFKKKQLQYEHRSLQQQKLRQIILQRKKQQLKPLRIDDLKQHERRYNSLKNQKQSIKQSEKKLRQQQLNNLTKINYPKSKYFNILQQQEEKQRERSIKENPKLIRSELIKKRDTYSKSVRQNYLPKGSPQKHKQLQKMMEKLKWTEQLKKNKISDRQYVIEGDKNLKQLHKLMAELKQQGRLPQQDKLSTLQTSPPKPSYKNYLEQLRKQNLAPKRRSLSIDHDDSKTIQLSDLKNMASKLELQANRRYTYANSNRDIQKNFKQMNKADDDYLQSVKAKVALLNKLS